MGFMTEISFLNDHHSRLEKYVREQPEEFLAELRELMNGRPQYGRGGIPYLGRGLSDDMRGAPYFTVFTSHHADEPRLYIAWQNSFVSLDVYDVKRQFGDRLDDPDDHLIGVIEKEISVAEYKLKGLKRFLKEKKEAHVA